MNNGGKLKLLMGAHGLSIDDVAEKLEASRDTVIAWLRPEDNASYRAMPNAKLRLFELLLKAESKK